MGVVALDVVLSGICAELTSVCRKTFSSNLRATVQGLEHCLCNCPSHAVIRETNKHQWTMRQVYFGYSQQRRGIFCSL